MDFSRFASFSLSLLTITAAAGTAAAQSEINNDRWLVTVSPYVWATSLDGHVTLAGRRAPVDVPLSLIHI